MIQFKSLCRTIPLLFATLIACGPAHAAAAFTPKLEPAPKVQPGFFQELTPACYVETNVSKEFTYKVAAMVKRAEAKFYTLFKLTPDLMQGWAKEKFDVKANIPGTIMQELHIRPWIDIRVYKDQEGFADEWFTLTKVTDPVQKATIGMPGAYFSLGPDSEYDKRAVRKIRSFVSDRDDEELERTLLHEMGHCFVESYMLGVAVGGGKQAGEDKRDLPAWLNEGIAQLFELNFTNTPSSKKARLKQQAMIYEAVKIGDSYKFEDFVNIANAHNLKAVADDPLKATINYAQSASVMDYMVNVDGAKFFDFLTNMRTFHLKRNLGNPDPNHVTEFFSFQDEAFKNAFNCKLTDVQKFWEKDLKTKMEATLKKTPEVHYWIGEYYLRRKKGKDADIKRAEEEFNIAMKEAPKSGEGYLGMGRMAMRKHDYTTALPLLEKAAKLMPKDEDAWYYLGLAQVNTGSHKEAVESFMASLKIFPRSPRGLYGLGEAAMAAKQYDKAMKAFDDAYAASRDPHYLYKKGDAAFFAKKYALAQAGYSAYVAIYKNDAQGHLMYGLSALRLGQKEFAMKEFQEAEKLQPNVEIIKQAIAMTEKGETLTLVGENQEPEVADNADKKDEIKDEKDPEKNPRPKPKS